MAGVWAVLLAAGESRRMGELKALLPWQGGTLIEHQVASLKAGGADRTVVVLGHQAERLIPRLEGREHLDWVVNHEYLQGKTTSVKAGLSALPSAGVSSVLLLNVDQPRSPEIVRRLLERHHAHANAITIPEFGGKGGHPIIMDSRLLPDLKAIDEETQGIKAVVRRYSEGVERVDLDEPEVLLDLNTREQYQAALNSLPG